jgi:DNA-3-methyladenine glycosylase I
MERCPWGFKEPLLLKYHDEEWGTPVHDERKHFEFLLLETMQAGLSWMTILRKREAFRQAFDDFDPQKIARYTDKKIKKLLHNPLIIRNKRKIEAAVYNAQLFIKIQMEFKSFDSYIWSFTGKKTIHNGCERLDQLPVTTELSDRVSLDLKKRGFNFVGSTTIYAHLQAIGIVNDHIRDCFRYKELIKLSK